ncbi:MAG: MaoC family dehydratase N-terminal domain-containing protein [Candidatus Doudnabacteria bacterium]|nr:MaoC family dehydratase N-terminal domain-containing protein [Candidatus Doudnabacteria bacterium]
MSTMTSPATGLSFADLSEGMEMVSSTTRTVTQELVAAYAEVSGDFNPIHLDEEFARRTRFKTRIAHGGLGWAIATGLASRLGFTKEAVIFKRIEEWNFIRPIRLGDELRLKVRIFGLKPVNPRKPLREPATARLAVELINQDIRVVQYGTWFAEFHTLELE